MNDIDRILLSTYHKSDTAWKVSKYGVISGPYFPVFVLNTNLFSRNTGKYGPEITPYLDTFHAVWLLAILLLPNYRRVSLKTLQKSIFADSCFFSSFQGFNEEPLDLQESIYEENHLVTVHLQEWIFLY